MCHPFICILITNPWANLICYTGQELERYNKLLSIVRSSLLELQRAVKGLIVMSAELEQLGRSLVNGTIPMMWAGKSYPSRKPLASYISDLIERVAFFQSWVTNGIPIIHWISGFFFTQSFLTGAKQNFARRHKVAIDMVDFEFEIRENQVCNSIYTNIQSTPKNTLYLLIFVMSICSSCKAKAICLV